MFMVEKQVKEYYLMGFFKQNKLPRLNLIIKLSVFLLLLLSLPLQAQIPVQSIRGQVTDQTGLPLPGVNVVVLDHDPARLAGAFAGVTGNMEVNAMVIRGNAPKGVLWLMEGIEILYSGSSLSGQVNSNIDDALLLLGGLYVPYFFIDRIRRCA